MANDITALRGEVALRFHNALAEAEMMASRVGFVRNDRTYTLKMKSQHLPNAFSSYTGTAPTATDIDSYNVGFTSDAAAAKVSITRKEMREASPSELVATAAAQLANQAIGEMDRVFSQGLATLFTATHPLDADLSGSGNKYLASTLTLTGAGPSGNDVVVSNLLTGALSETTLAQARQLLLEQTNWAGDSLGLTGPFTLICSPKNEKLARQITGSAVTDQSASNPQGYRNLYGNISVEVSNYLSDDDDWYLCYRGLNDGGLGSAVGMWVPEMPSIAIRQEDHFSTVIEAYYDASFVYSPDGLGIIGSNVA